MAEEINFDEFTQTDDNGAQNVTIDNETGIVEDQTVYSQTFNSRSAANQVLDVLDRLDMDDRYQVSKDGKTVMIVADAREMDIISRKIRIDTWSKATVAISSKVTNFATDVADYALNGALAPSAVAVGNAALTTGRVVATAGVKIGAGVAASTIRNVRAAATELKHSEEVADLGNELGRLWGDIGSALFGSNDNGSSGWEKTK